MNKPRAPKVIPPLPLTEDWIPHWPKPKPRAVGSVLQQPAQGMLPILSRSELPILSRSEITNLNALLEHLQIEDWHYLLIGDGSGSNWDRAVGWATVVIENDTYIKKVHYGAANHGTVNMAEMMAYLQPIECLYSQELERRKTAPFRALRLHIVTDSNYCKVQGNAGSRIKPKARNGAMWAAMHAFSRQGFVLTWHHMPRESHEFNRYCDRLSRTARLAMQKAQAPHEPEEGIDETRVTGIR